METLLALINNPLNSDDFVSYSAEMASDMKFNLHFLYIQNPALYSLSSGSAAATAHPVGSEVEITRLEEERKNAVKSIEKKLEDFKKSVSADININVSSETGAMDMVVNRLVVEGEADMILLENQNEEGLWILDSTNSQLIIKAKCPGWLIPKGLKYQPYRKIVYATDYNLKDIQVLNNLKDMTGRFSPEITVLHVTGSGRKEIEKKPEFEKSIAEQTGNDKISVEYIKEEKDRDLGETINDYAEKADADLIVLLKENKTFFERIFTPSDTKKVIKKAGLPVLMYHEKVIK